MLPLRLKKSKEFFTILLGLIIFGMLANVAIMNILPNVVTNQLIQNHLLSLIQVEALLSNSNFSYFLGLVFAGIFFDFVEMRKAFLTTFIFATIGVYLLGHSINFSILTASTILLRLSSALMLIGILKQIFMILTKKNFAIFIGFFLPISIIVERYSNPVLVSMLQVISLKQISLIFILIVILSFLGIFWVTQHFAKANSLSMEAKLFVVKKLLGNSNLWITAAIAFLIASYSLFETLYGPLFLIQAAHYSTQDMSAIMVWFYYGIFLGTPIACVISQWIKNRKIFLFIGPVVSGICIAFILCHIPNQMILSTVLFLFGFFISTSAILYLVICDISTWMNCGSAVSCILIFKQLGSSSFSFMLLSHLLGFIVLEPLLKHIDRVCISWAHPLMAMPLLLVLAGFGALLLKPKANFLEHDEHI